MSINQPLFPTYGAGQLVSVGNTASSVFVTGNNKQIEFTVPLSSTQIVFVRITENDDTSGAVVNADYPILPGMKLVLSKPESHNRVSFIAPASGSIMYMIPCEGF